MKIVALDPGGTTGYCSATVSKDRLEHIKSGQISGHDHHLELYRFLVNERPSLILCESFEYRQKSRAGLVLDSREYIGVAKLYSVQNEIYYLQQSASQAKGFATDSAIKNLGWYKTSNPHAMDAVRHMIYFAVNGNHDMEAFRMYVLKFGFRR